MHSRKFGALAAAAAALALGVAACGGDDDGGGSSGGGGGGGGGDQPYIAIVSKGFQHQFWQAVKKGAEDEAKKVGARITFQGPPTEQDIEQQVTMLTNALQQKPDALGFAALDSKASAPLMDQAKSQNIPVVAFDSGVESDVPVTTAATDNKAAAAEAAKHLAEAIGNKGKVAVVVHDQTSRSGIDRRDGFLAWMKENAPDIRVLPVQYGGGDQAKSADIAKSIISANKDLKGFYGANEGSAIGVIKGVQESGRKGITIVGFDSGKAQIDAIKSGVMDGAITQNPVGMGKELVDAATKAIKGEKLPKVIDTGFYWYDKSNIDDPKIKAVLYQ
jgi:ribose transport system substrate-binding protein